MSSETKVAIQCFLFVVIVGMGGMWLMKETGLIGQAEETVEQDRPPVSNPHRGTHQ